MAQDTRTRRIAAIAFGVLVLATFAAFFLAQRLKQAPPAVEARVVTRVFSPNGDGRADVARFRLRLRKADEVTVTVLDRETDRPVRRLATDRPVPAGRPVELAWDGRTDARRIAPDAYYKLLITLREQGRSSVANKRFILDTRPPTPAVTAVGPGRGPLVVPAPGGDPAVRVRVSDPGLEPPRFTVWRTDGPRPRAVAGFSAPAGAGEARWDGLVDGAPAAAGTYLIAVRTRERSGNAGEFPDVPADFARAARAPEGAPRPPGLFSRGRPGVTVRRLAAVVPIEPVVAGEPLEAFVDARGGRYRWELRRVGRRRPVAEGATGSPRLRVRAPRSAGAHLLVLRTSRATYATPVAVRPARARPMLVVLPALSWQGRNPVDDDGQGLPDTLARSGRARLARPYAGDGLPLGFGEQEGPLLTWLLRRGYAYDLTTDAALAAGRGPRLEGHRGVVLAGEPRWLPAGVQAGLRRYAQGGGRVLTLGTDALRRTVSVGRDALDRPTAPAPEDVFDARTRPLARRPIDLVAYEDDRSLRLFAGTAGLITGYDRLEVATSLGAGRLLSAAGPEEGRPVIAASRFGRGLVIRTGLAQFSAGLTSDPETATVGRRMWAILSAR